VAVRCEERFNEGDWQTSEFGPPYLADAQASFICSLVNRVDHGTHSVFIGEVELAKAADVVDPLVYVDGRYLAPTAE
jgi:flavin reductase (DIM6/NTAB) family NADH-FMN oxidoreductase RutF